MSDYDRKIRLYALAAPQLFAERTEAIARLVLEALGVAPSPKQQVYISPVSGWFEYTALDELWERRVRPELPDKAAAQKAAETALTRLQEKCSDANRGWPEALRETTLFPPVGLLRRVDLGAVLRPDGSAWDHWLYRATPQLYLDGGSKTRVDVHGAHVELRIGQRGQAISVRSRWSPISREQKYTDLLPPPAEAHAHGAPPPPAPHGHDPGDDLEHEHEQAHPAAPPIRYVLDGDNIPQHYLAPYYFGMAGHHSTVASASPFSLTVELFLIENDRTLPRVRAVADGGSGDYLYDWAIYSLARPGDGLRLLGRGASTQVNGARGKVVASTVEIEPGAYVVLVNVKDRASGAFKHRQQQVFTGPLATPKESAPPRVA